MKKIFLHIVLFCLVTFSKAQSSNGPGTFYADVTSGCAPLTVNMSDTDPAINNSVVAYKFEETDSPVFVPTHTYTKPGIYTIDQWVFGNNGGGQVKYQKIDYITVLSSTPPNLYIAQCEGGIIKIVTDNTYDKYIINLNNEKIDTVGPSTTYTHTFNTFTPKVISIKGRHLPSWCGSGDYTQTIVPLNTLIAPDFTALTVNEQSANGSVSLQFNATLDQRYIVQQSTNSTSNANFVDIDTLSALTGLQSYTVSNLNTQNNSYCFRLLTIDDCNPPIVSDIICSIINNTVANNNANGISWNSDITGKVVNYKINKNLPPGTIIGPLPVSTTSYNDLEVQCGNEYCYIIESTINGTGPTPVLHSYSARQCVTANSTNIPPAVQNLNSTFENGTVLLTWDNPILAKVKIYQISRSTNNGTFSLINERTTNTYNDQTITIPEETYCYQVKYKDSCDMESLISTNTCPVILSGSLDPTNKLKNNLAWTTYSGSWVPSEYILERLDQSNQVVSYVSVGAGLSYQDIFGNSSGQFSKYRIKAQGNTSTQVSYSNLLELKFEGEVYLPTAFTPNGDGNNDIFYASGSFIKEFNMMIFNRWGEVVFATDQLTNGWNGLYNGVPANQDAYAYLIEATDMWGKRITKRGSVTLLK